MPGKHRVVVVGGGFGGLQVVRCLRGANVEVTLIDQRNFHLFQPLLYQVATGGLSPGDIAAPLRGILSNQKNVRVLLGEVVDIDPCSRMVCFRQGGTIAYDSLVVATGAQSHYFGNEAWRKWAQSLRTVEDATAIRRKVLYAFEAAEFDPDPDSRAAWLTFVIVGAGPTGIELAGALSEIAQHTLRNNFRAIEPKFAKIVILDCAPRVLPAMPEDLSERAQSALLRLGIQIRTGVRVTRLDGETITFEEEGVAQTITTRTVLWAGGVTVSQLGRVLAKRTNAQTDRGGRIIVNPDLTIRAQPDIYVIGDLAHYERRDGTPLPGVAPVAMQQGSYAAAVIASRTRNGPAPRRFQYVDRGEMAVIGRASAVANIFGLHVSGYTAWLTWLFVHLMYLVEFRSRVMVFMHWGYQYLTFGRGARLITGKVRQGRVSGSGPDAETAMSEALRDAPRTAA